MIWLDFEQGVKFLHAVCSLIVSDIEQPILTHLCIQGEECFALG